MTLPRFVSCAPMRSHLYRITDDRDCYYVEVPATWTTPQVRSALRPHLAPGAFPLIQWAPQAESLGVEPKYTFTS